MKCSIKCLIRCLKSSFINSFIRKCVILLFLIFCFFFNAAPIYKKLAKPLIQQPGAEKLTEFAGLKSEDKADLMRKISSSNTQTEQIELAQQHKHKNTYNYYDDYSYRYHYYNNYYSNKYYRQEPNCQGEWRLAADGKYWWHPAPYLHNPTSYMHNHNFNVIYNQLSKSLSSF